MKFNYKNKLFSILIWLILSGFTLLGCGSDNATTTDAPAVASDVDLYVTTANQSYLFKKIPLSFCTKDNMSPYTIQMNPSEVFQEMDGFGAAMTGSSCYNLLKMTAEDRAKLLKETFDPKDGMGYSYIRVSIGASDFSLSEYTYCDTPGIGNFALQSEDKNYVIPVLKEILAINPNVKILASPWNDATQSFTNGFPCNKQNDILTFYYKYTPTVTGSKATANINLNKNGRQVGGMWMELEATNTYKYFEVPFSTMEIPDEASISFQSNNNETLSLNDVGSVLKVDKLAFKSELTNIPESKANNESVKLYPMPFKTSCTLEINPTLDISGMQLSIYNSAGSLVRQDKITNYQTTIYKGNLVSGTYLLEVIKDKATIFNKKIIVE